MDPVPNVLTSAELKPRGMAAIEPALQWLINLPPASQPLSKTALDAEPIWAEALKEHLRRGHQASLARAHAGCR